MRGIYIGRILYPVTVLGPGKRLGIWMAGCSMQCPGCMTRDLWEQRPGQKMTLCQIAEIIEKLPQGLEKAVISGGEPFEQPVALLELLKLLRTREFTDTWVYTGQRIEVLQQDCNACLDMIDVLIDGPFIQSQPTDLVWRGSANQRMHLLSEQAKRIHEKWVSLESPKHPVQVIPSQDGYEVIGVPKAGKWV